MTLVWQRNQSPPCWLMWHKRWLSWGSGYLWLKFTELYYRICFKKVGPSPSLSYNLRDTKALTCAPANMLLPLQRMKSISWVQPITSCKMPHIHKTLLSNKQSHNKQYHKLQGLTTKTFSSAKGPLYSWPFNNLGRRDTDQSRKLCM